ncbi:hypothetical protein [Streptomyces sp. NPDC001380]|uniref:hypothetical protein n=1 Tax=Streptomyces sp. NPDC001380 TaxID=3364566 RepID=UPI003692F697
MPVLVPVFSHRFLPAFRGTTGDPVLSVYQTDIIYSGADLAGYLLREFGPTGRSREVENANRIPFWSFFLEDADPVPEYPCPSREG